MILLAVYLESAGKNVTQIHPVPHLATVESVKQIRIESESKIAGNRCYWNMQDERTQGRRWVLSSFEETRSAAAEIANVAKRILSIYTLDLEPGLFDHDEFLNVAKRLVLSKRYGRIRVLISDPYRASRNGNRFVAVGRRLNSSIEFRNVHEDYKEHREAYIIADDTALLYRGDSTRWEGIADTYEPAVAKRYLKQFDEIWVASETAREIRELRV